MDRYSFPYQWLYNGLCNEYSWRGPIENSPYNSGGFESSINLLFHSLRLTSGNNCDTCVRWVCNLYMLFRWSRNPCRWYFHWWDLWFNGNVVSRSTFQPDVSRSLGIVSKPAYSLYDMLMTSRYQCRVFSDLVRIKPMSITASGIFALVDLVIVSSLYYLLATSRTGFSR